MVMGIYQQTNIIGSSKSMESSAPRRKFYRSCRSPTRTMTGKNNHCSIRRKIRVKFCCSRTNALDLSFFQATEQGGVLGGVGRAKSSTLRAKN